MIRILALSLFVCFTFICNAQQDSLQQIEAVKITTLRTEKTEVISHRIDQETIQRHPAQQVSELLNQLPGFHIQESLGNAGSPQLYSVRGGRSKDVLFLVNGIPVGDASQISGFQDLNLIPIESIEYIEVVYGGSSVLYGSNASAAVVNITTKQAFTTTPIQSALEIGKWNSIRQSFQVGGKNKKGTLAYLANSAHFITDGFSAAQDTLNTNRFDEDASKRHSFMGNLTYEKEALSIGWMNTFSLHEFDFDGGAFLDSDDIQNNKEFKSQLKLNWKHSQQAEMTVNTGYQKNKRTQENSFSPNNNRRFAQFDAQTFHLEVFEKMKLSNSTTLVAGLYGATSNTDQYGVDFFSNEYVQNIARDSAAFTVFDPYLYVQFNPTSRFDVNLGGRLNTHSDYGSHLVYQGSASYDIVQNAAFKFRVNAGYSTAYITPSLFQLYSSFGNQDLEPEESATASGGFSFQFEDKLQLNATAYRRDESVLIGFSNSTFAYANSLEDTYAEGIEATLKFTPNEELNASAFFAQVDRENDVELYRIPTSEWGGAASLRPKAVPNFMFTADYRRVGQRTMPLFNTTTFQTDEFDLDGYNALNFTASADFWDKQIQTYITARNITEDDYIDNLGYNAEGFNVRIGAKFRMK